MRLRANYLHRTPIGIVSRVVDMLIDEGQPAQSRTVAVSGKTCCYGKTEIEDQDDTSHECVDRNAVPWPGQTQATCTKGTTGYKQPGEVLRVTHIAAGQKDLDLLLTHRPAESAERWRESKTVPADSLIQLTRFKLLGQLSKIPPWK